MQTPYLHFTNIVLTLCQNYAKTILKLYQDVTNKHCTIGPSKTNKKVMVCLDEGSLDREMDERVLEVHFKNNATLYSILNTAIFYPQQWEGSMLRNLASMFSLRGMASFTHFLWHTVNSADNWAQNAFEQSCPGITLKVLQHCTNTTLTPYSHYTNTILTLN
jgi:hypothetical protein